MPNPGGGRPDPNARDSSSTDWKRLHLWQIQPIRDVLVLAAAFGVLYLGYLISIVTVPLLLALLLAYLFEPVVARLTRRGRMKRSVAAGGLIAAVVFLLVVPVTVGLAFGAVQGVRFVQGVSENAVVLGQAIDPTRSEAEREEARAQLPNNSWRSAADKLVELGVGEAVARQIQSGSDSEADEAGEEGVPPAEAQEAGAADEGAVETEERPAAIQDSLLAGFVAASIDWAQGNRGRIGQLAARRSVDLLGATLRGITTIGVVVFGVFLTAFFFFFISISYQGVLDFGARLIPDSHRERSLYLLQQFDRVIAGFVRGRLTIAAIQCVVFSIGYYLIGTPAALLVGITVGILSIVPYLALIGIPISITLMWLDPADGFRGEWWWILTAPVGWYFIGQALDDYVLTPKIQGESTGLDTPTVLFASIAGGVLAGFYGLLIAIPVAACLKIMLREVVWPKFNEWVAGRAQDPLPIGRAED